MAVDRQAHGLALWQRLIWWRIRLVVNYYSVRVYNCVLDLLLVDSFGILEYAKIGTLNLLFRSFQIPKRMVDVLRKKTLRRLRSEFICAGAQSTVADSLTSLRCRVIHQHAKIACLIGNAYVGHSFRRVCICSFP